MSTATSFLLAVLVDLAVVAVWEHHRYHKRQDALAKALETARKRATQGDDIDKQYRRDIDAAWGPRPHSIHLGGSDAR